MIWQKKAIATWLLLFLFAGLFLFLTGCRLFYRPVRKTGTIPRDVVEREKQLLAERMESWELGVREIYEENDNPVQARRAASRLTRRLARAQRVHDMFVQKLYHPEDNIPFTREEWRQATYVGCRRYR